MFDPTVFRTTPFELMRRMGGGEEHPGRAAPPGVATVPVNIWQGPESATLTALLPGVAAESLEVSVKDDVLTLSGAHAASEAETGGAWHRRERDTARFSRAVRLPFRVDPERLEARLSDGRLEVALHRRREDLPRRIEVKAA